MVLVAYLKSAIGASKVAQILSNVLCIFCLLLAMYRDRSKVVDLPMHWRLEFFLSLNVASLAYSLCFSVLCLTVSYRNMPRDFLKIDLLFTLLFAVIFFVASFFVLETAFYYQTHYPTWKSIQVFDSCFAGFVVASFYIIGLAAVAMKLRRNEQFMPQILTENDVAADTIGRVHDKELPRNKELQDASTVL